MDRSLACLVVELAGSGGEEKAWKVWLSYAGLRMRLMRGQVYLHYASGPRTCEFRGQTYLCWHQIQVQFRQIDRTACLERKGQVGHLPGIPLSVA